MIGGSRGIRLSIAHKLYRDHNILVASRTQDSLTGLPVRHIAFDATTDSLDPAELPDQLHGFVYCPGSIHLKPFEMIPQEVLEEDMHLNFFSMTRVLRTILPKLTGESSVVLFSTVAVGKGMPYHTSVAAAKGAIEGFARALAAEVAPKIRINVLAPSLVDTSLAKRLLNNDKKREMMAARHPMKRIGTAEDMANMACFLLSDDSNWMTGQVIGVDGGFLRWTYIDPPDQAGQALKLGICTFRICECNE